MTRLDLISLSDLPVSVGRYTLTGLLGEGGMARVFRAQMEGSLGFKKPAAVKVVLPAGGDRGASLRQQLIQEARLGGLLNHPNVVQTFDCGELEGFPYIAMELVEGPGLDDLVEEVGPLGPAALLDATIGIARGLHHAHTAQHEGVPLNIIHRDIKPSNVLIREDGVVKVMDFGIAKVAMQDALSTATGMTKGTPSYMSPEQLAADPLDARTDLFALGALMHYMRTGKTLFVGSSLTEVMLRIIQVDETIRDRGILREADEYLPGLGAIMGRLLVKDTSERFNTAAELEHELSILRKRLHQDHRILALLVAQHFGDRLADERAKAASVTGPSPFARDAKAVAAPDAESATPGPTRAFPAGGTVGSVGASVVMPDTVATPSLTDAPASGDAGGGWARGRVDDANPPAAVGTQTRPQFSAQESAAKSVPAPRAGKTVPPPRKRRKKRAAPARKRKQGALFVVGILAGALIAALVVGLLLRGGGGESEPEVAEPSSEPSLVPDDLYEQPTPSKRRVKKPRRTPPPVVREPTPAPRPDPTPAPRPDPTPEPTPAPRPEPTPEPTPRAKPDRTPAPPPDVPAELRLSADHVPVRRATMGTTKSIVVNAEGPAGTTVILYYGPPGGPHQSTRLDAQGGGVYKGGISVGEALGGGFEYWVVVKNKRSTPQVVPLGRQSAPYSVSVF